MSIPVCPKYVQVIAPRAILDNDSWTTTEVDTLGYRYARMCVMLGATDIALTALTLTEGDTTGQATTAVTGGVFGTSVGIGGSTSTLPSATDDNKIFIFNIDLRGRKRFLDLTATIDNGTAGGYAAAWCELHDGENAPTSAAGMGASQVLNIPAYA